MIFNFQTFFGYYFTLSQVLALYTCFSPKFFTVIALTEIWAQMLLCLRKLEMAGLNQNLHQASPLFPHT